MSDEYQDDLPWELGGGSVEVEIRDVLDLHSFKPREIRDVVLEWLDAAWAMGFRELRLIHGRGIGTQRQIVRSVLSKHERVSSFSDAPADAGGWGATLITLRDR